MIKTKEWKSGDRTYYIKNLGGEAAMDLFPTVQIALLPIFVGVVHANEEQIWKSLQGLKEYPTIARTMEEHITVNLGDPKAPAVPVKTVADTIFAQRQMERYALCRQALEWSYADFFAEWLPAVTKAVAKMLREILVSSIPSKSTGGPGESSSTPPSEGEPVSATSSNDGASAT